MVTIHHKEVDIHFVMYTASSSELLTLSPDTASIIQANRSYLDQKLADPTAIFYGINTGFGSLCNVQISPSQLADLQRNLVLSHACGMGDLVPINIIKLIFLLKIINLSKGKSGVRLELINHMIAVYNAGILPVIYTQGSLGASGDLAPLAHLSCMLIGEGDAYCPSGKIVRARDALRDSKIIPITLQAKEGLALLNGTQFSLAYSISILFDIDRLWLPITTISAMSTDAFLCDVAPFHEALHKIRPHAGQIKVAHEMYNLLSSSELRNLDKSSVQDPYSFRCIPQVHGASWNAIEHAMSVVTIELNSVTDNPMIFDHEDLILSGGNFHAQPLALVLDYLALALAELGSISERRIYQLINGDRSLPPFLTEGAGLHSGYMIAQYTAASIVSQSKQYCTPASVDSILSSKGQEDHVSMAANAATKCLKVFDNLVSIIAIEWNIAAQALDYRRPCKSSPPVESYHRLLREEVPHLSHDRFLHDDLIKTRKILESL